MGNFSACFCLRTTQMTATAKLLDADGTLIGKIKLPAKAAELMLEKPGFVISPADELRRSRRISALRADDELLAGKVYVMVPAGRVRSRVSTSELKNIELGCKNKMKPAAGNGSKVLPAMTEKIGEESKSCDQLGFFHGNKHWNPKLETICEDFSLSFREIK